jgi:hypothetical protein
MAQVRPYQLGPGVGRAGHSHVALLTPDLLRPNIDLPEHIGDQPAWPIASSMLSSMTLRVSDEAGSVPFAASCHRVVAAGQPRFYDYRSQDAETLVESPMCGPDPTTLVLLPEHRRSVASNLRRAK